SVSARCVPNRYGQRPSAGSRSAATWKQRSASGSWWYARRTIPYSPHAAADRGSNSTWWYIVYTSICTTRSVNASMSGRGTSGPGFSRFLHHTAHATAPPTAATMNQARQRLSRIRIVSPLDVAHLTAKEEGAWSAVLSLTSILSGGQVEQMFGPGADPAEFHLGTQR